jgi:transcriptional regulator with XRE-family HTH domain
MKFAALAREYRKKNRRYLREVADATGLSVAMISEVERGNRPPPIYAVREWAAAVLGDPDEFEAAAMVARDILTIRYDELNPAQKLASFFFAKSIDQLSDEACERIKDIVLRDVIP